MTDFFSSNEGCILSFPNIFDVIKIINFFISEKNETLAFVITGIFIVFTCTYLIPRGFKIPALIFLFTISSVFWCMFRYIRSKQIQMINSRFNHEANLRNQSNIEAISANTEGIPRVIPGSNRFNQPYFTFEVIPNTAPMPRAGLSNTNTVTRPLPAQVRQSQNFKIYILMLRPQINVLVCL